MISYLSTLVFLFQLSDNKQCHVGPAFGVVEGKVCSSSSSNSSSGSRYKIISKYRKSVCCVLISDCRACEIFGHPYFWFEGCRLVFRCNRNYAYTSTHFDFIVFPDTKHTKYLTRPPHYSSSIHISCLAITGWQLESVSHDIWSYMTSHEE